MYLKSTSCRGDDWKATTSRIGMIRCLWLSCHGYWQNRLLYPVASIHASAFDCQRGSTYTIIRTVAMVETQDTLHKSCSWPGTYILSSIPSTQPLTSFFNMSHSWGFPPDPRGSGAGAPKKTCSNWTNITNLQNSISNQSIYVDCASR